MDLTQAFYTRMADDAELIALLAVYESVSAIFTDENVPENAVPPFVWSPGEVGAVPDDVKNQEGRRIMRDIGAYTRRTGSSAEVDAIAERVRALFHRHPLAITGFRTIVPLCTGPIVAPTDDTMIGRIVTVHLRIENA